MPTWVRGNDVFIGAHSGIALFVGNFTERVPLNLDEESPSDPLNFMVQPGVLRGWNMFVGTNTSTTDIDINFAKEVYDGGTGYAAETEFTMFTVPAGELGYFCAPKITTELADRSWARWDKVGVIMRRSAATGSFIRLTFACLLENIEETLLDTQQPPNRPIVG